MAGILGGILGGDNGGDDQQNSSDSSANAEGNAVNILGLDATNSSYERDEDGNESSNDSSLSLDNGTSLDSLVDSMTSNDSSSS